MNTQLVFVDRIQQSINKEKYEINNSIAGRQCQLKSGKHRFEVIHKYKTFSS